MALVQVTPRDRLQRLADLGQKTLRYWWLVAVFAVVGGGLSLAFAMFKSKTYQSWATLFYQERIETQLMTPNREEQVQRNIGDRYRELLLARGQLQQVLADPKLDPFPDVDDPDQKIEKLREKIKFEARGANTFRIVYNDVDPERAKAVTLRLTELLQGKDKDLRNEIAEATVNFATEQKEAASTQLRESEKKLAAFLAQHPEFAQDSNVANAEGAGIRAIRDANKKNQTGNTRLYALERQRMRIQARLNANPDEPPVVQPAPKTPERIAAEANVDDARRELASANRDLEEAKTRYTDKHPAVIKAQSAVAAAQLRVRQAQAAIPPAVEITVAPATPQDRTKLERELRQLEEQIASEQKKATAGSSSAATDKTTNWVVQLETEHADLRRQVNEQRERVEALADSVFRAQIDASQKLAERGGRLSVVDPAFKPVKPTGPGRTIFLLAGMVLFLSLGTALAVGMAVIDDRLYRRYDIDQLGFRVLAVIPKATAAPARRSAARKEAS